MDDWTDAAVERRKRHDVRRRGPSRAIFGLVFLISSASAGEMPPDPFIDLYPTGPLDGRPTTPIFATGPVDRASIYSRLQIVRVSLETLQTIAARVLEFDAHHHLPDDFVLPSGGWTFALCMKGGCTSREELDAVAGFMPFETCQLMKVIADIPEVAANLSQSAIVASYARRESCAPKK